MSDDDENEKQALINISTGGFSKTAVAFIKKFSPVATHIAQAEVAAMTIKADGMLAINERMRRAGHRILWKEGNIESIVCLAEKYMSPEGREEKAKNLDQDWAATFADECENTSDKEMQIKWAKILAGEADKPGTFSKKTLSLLNDMSKEDAKLFTAFCQFVWTDLSSTSENNRPLIYDTNNIIYTDEGIDIEALEHLREFGLITYNGMLAFNSFANTPTQDTPQHRIIIMSYYGKVVTVSQESSNDSPTVAGRYSFTESGEELFQICKTQKNDEFFNYVITEWKKRKYITEFPNSRNAVKKTTE